MSRGSENKAPFGAPPKAAGNTPNRRQHRRAAADGAGRLIHRLDEAVVDLVDLSYGGARIAYPRGLVPKIGEGVCINFLDGSSVFGRVAWINGKQIGVCFTKIVPDIHDRADGTSDGKTLFTRIVSIQLQRQSE